MTSTTLVASTEASTGKTAVALALATAARDAGRSVGYMKPKGTRLSSAVGKTLDRDPLLARDLLDLDDNTGDMEPVVYSPTFVAEAMRGGTDPDALRDRVREAFDTLSEGRDAMVVEGADAPDTGRAVELDERAVADLLDAEVVLLARYTEPRDVDTVLAAADALGDRLSGVLFNAVADAEYDTVAEEVTPFLERRGVPVLGVVPREPSLAGVTVAELAEELGGRTVTDGATDARVERFLVGAMGGESALAHFRRTKDAVVVTGGDRADIQTAALDAPGVRALVLTGGYEPSGSVAGRAEREGVPVVVVDGDTRGTVERTEALLEGGRTRDAEAVARMRDLLAAHAPTLLPE
ncbi:phosphotransacetylase family protein [Halosegnis marinus]|uniref:AAA family ATPase n=1 Tax=Halosegnis marinus TaxID=3034023 RepID=A0ABD5ZN04_9EURY|nr:phosphotransacetylase family protein [Halosegnis sp. DT85]